MNFRIPALAGALIAGLAAVAAAQSAPPTPPPVVAPGVPTAAPTLLAPSAPPTAAPTRRGKSKGAATPAPEASPTDTPEPPQFDTLTGVWEVAVQPLLAARAIYSHLYITQNNNDLTGTWLRADKKTRLPFTGSFDGRLFKITIMDGAKTYTMSGYAENFGDMVGMLQMDPKTDGVAFTASHRKKSKLEK